MTALVKRVRGDLNRYKLQAADTPIDLPSVVGEVCEAIVPVIGQFAHQGLLATGALPEPERYASECSKGFMHTTCRSHATVEEAEAAEEQTYESDEDGIRR